MKMEDRPGTGLPVKAPLEAVTDHTLVPLVLSACRRPRAAFPAPLSVPTTMMPWHVRCSGVDVVKTSPLEASCVVKLHSSCPEVPLKAYTRAPAGCTTVLDVALLSSAPQQAPVPSSVGCTSGCPESSLVRHTVAPVVSTALSTPTPASEPFLVATTSGPAWSAMGLPAGAPGSDTFHMAAPSAKRTRRRLPPGGPVALPVAT